MKKIDYRLIPYHNTFPAMKEIFLSRFRARAAQFAFVGLVTNTIPSTGKYLKL